MESGKESTGEATEGRVRSQDHISDFSFFASLVTVVGFALAVVFGGFPVGLTLLFVVAITLVMSAVLVARGESARLVGVAASSLVVLTITSLLVADRLGGDEPVEEDGAIGSSQTVTSDVQPSAARIEDGGTLVGCGSSEGEAELVYETAGRNPVVHLEIENDPRKFDGTDPAARGQYLVYLEPGQHRVSVVDAHSEDVVASRLFEAKLSDPTISADGRVVLAVAEDQAGTSIIRWEPSTGEVSIVHDPSGPVSSPSITDDGALVAWVAGDPSSMHVAIAELDGGVFEQTMSWPGSDPSWSPDGSTVAFVAPHNDGSAVYLRSTLEASETRLSNPTSGDVDSGPVWSPDCSFVAFTRTVGSEADIWVTDGGPVDTLYRERDGIQVNAAFTTTESDNNSVLDP